MDEGHPQKDKNERRLQFNDKIFKIFKIKANSSHLYCNADDDKIANNLLIIVQGS